jgi:two-component sensor histidine kinase
VQPSVRRGFGLDLIERSVAYELDGQAVLEYRVEGLSCEITGPLTGSIAVDGYPGNLLRRASCPP